MERQRPYASILQLKLPRLRLATTPKGNQQPMKTILTILMTIVLILAALALAPAAIGAIDQLTAVSDQLTNNAGGSAPLVIQLETMPPAQNPAVTAVYQLPEPTAVPTEKQPETAVSPTNTPTPAPVVNVQGNTPDAIEAACNAAAEAGRRGSPRCAENRPTATPAGMGR